MKELLNFEEANLQNKLFVEIDFFFLWNRKFFMYTAPVWTLTWVQGSQDILGFIDFIKPVSVLNKSTDTGFNTVSVLLLM